MYNWLIILINIIKYHNIYNKILEMTIEFDIIKFV